MIVYLDNNRYKLKLSNMNVLSHYVNQLVFCGYIEKHSLMFILDFPSFNLYGESGKEYIFNKNIEINDYKVGQFIESIRDKLYLLLLKLNFNNIKVVFKVIDDDFFISSLIINYKRIYLCNLLWNIMNEIGLKPLTCIDSISKLSRDNISKIKKFCINEYKNNNNFLGLSLFFPNTDKNIFIGKEFLKNKIL